MDELRCPGCGTPTLGVARFCSNCGCDMHPETPASRVGASVFKVVCAVLASIGFLALGLVGACFGMLFGSAAGDAGVWMGLAAAVAVTGWLWILSMMSIFKRE